MAAGARAGEEAIPACECGGLQSRIAERQRLVGNKTIEAKILREAVSRVEGQKLLFR